MHRSVIFIVSSFMVSSCTSSSPSPSTAADACDSVGVSLCAKMYACYDADQIAGFGYPTTQDACVAQLNASCDLASPEPGYCKGNAQVSAAAATTCSDYLDAMSCSDFEMPDTGTECKQDLCAQ